MYTGDLGGRTTFELEVTYCTTVLNVVVETSLDKTGGGAGTEVTVCAGVLVGALEDDEAALWVDEDLV